MLSMIVTSISNIVSPTKKLYQATAVYMMVQSCLNNTNSLWHLIPMLRTCQNRWP